MTVLLSPQQRRGFSIDKARTRRAYRNDVKEFTAFAGIERPEEMRRVTRAHLIAWL